MSKSPSGTPKLDRSTKKHSRRLMIASPQFSRQLKRRLARNYRKISELERQLESALKREQIENVKRRRLISDITKLTVRIYQLQWTARERIDRGRSTKRTKSINGLLKTLSRIEARLLSDEFDKFPDDYLAQEAGRDLKQERLAALSNLRDNLTSIKGRVGQRNELKRHLALQLKRVFDLHEICCRKSKAYSTFERTFQVCCSHLYLRQTDNVWYFLRKT